MAMLTGALAYLFLAHVSWVAPVKPFVHELVAWLAPLLIFAQLFLTFCRIDVRELRPRRWHAWLLLFQLVACLSV